MPHQGIVITAGFNRSKSALALAERFKQLSVPVQGIIVVSPYTVHRLSKMVQKRGPAFIKQAIPRLLGRRRSSPDLGADYLQNYLELHSIPDISLSQWAQENNAKFLSVSSINATKVIEYLQEQPLTWLIYSGGGIIKTDVITAVEGCILNAHQGPLPQTRGMNACEWSILLDYKQEVTIHFIDKDIDTGKIITSKSFSIQQGDTIESLRSKAIVRGIEGLLEVGAKETLDDYQLRSNHANYRQCYMLSPQLKDLLNEKLKVITSREK